MNATPELPRLFSRTVFISDVHLGFERCNAEALLTFLDVIETETLYLVGDLIDLACASSALRWPRAHHEVIRRILTLADQGTRVVYVPGNHDCPMRGFVGARFGSIEICRDALHETADGRRFLVRPDSFIPPAARSITQISPRAGAVTRASQGCVAHPRARLLQGPARDEAKP